MKCRRSLSFVAPALLLGLTAGASFAQTPPTIPANPPAATPPPAPQTPPAMRMPPTMPPPPGQMPQPAHAAAPFPPPPVKGGPAGVAAVVNGKTITNAQLTQTALQVAGNKALRQLIVTNLVEQAAQAHHVTASHNEIAARLAQVKAEIARQFGIGLDAYLSQSDQTMATLTQNLRLDILAEKLATQGQPQPYQVHIHLLVVLTNNAEHNPNATPHTQAEALVIIQKAQADLAAGQSFDAVVAKYSEANKTNGGDINELIGQDSPAPFASAALKLQPGQVSDPIYSASFGYFLVKVVSSTTHPIDVETHQLDPLYAAAAEARNSQAAKTYVAALIPKAKITNYFFP